MPVIRISDALYERLEALAEGFDAPENVIERFIKISDALYERLEALAEGFDDTPEKVIERLVNEVKGIDTENGGDGDRVEIESNYINYVNSNTKTNQGNNYLNYILKLEKRLDERILGVYSLDELEVISGRFSGDGDLYEFNQMYNGFPSAAIGKLIDFCRTESQKTD